MSTQTTSQQRLRPFKPTPFGRYTLLLPLSTGGMGEIFLARLEGTRGFEKLCVIKRILPHLAGDPEFLERFRNEATTLVQLQHGAIAQILDMGIVDGTPYLAMEYVDGKDLRRVAARAQDRALPLPLTFVLYVMTRVLDALAYAHRKRDEDERELGLVHRDVSPQNILISYEGEVKVIDFGLVKSTLNVNKTNPSIVLGKFLYMSPEQARHQNVDRRSDLYSVGLCLYELIAGKNPFDDAGSGELMAQVASPNIRPLQQVEQFTPPAVAQAVMRALAPDPAHRFQTAEEFRGRLTACLLEIDPSAGPENASRFMREAFAAEHQAERKLHASLREALRPPEDEPDTGVHLMGPPAGRPVLEAVPPRRDASPLSFKPTPSSRALNTDFSDRDRETVPGVMVDPGLRDIGLGFEPETGQAPVVVDPNDTLPPPMPSPGIITGRLMEPTEPLGASLKVLEARGRSPGPPSPKVVLRPDNTTETTDPSLAPVPPRRGEQTRPLVSSTAATVVPPAPPPRRSESSRALPTTPEVPITPAPPPPIPALSPSGRAARTQPEARPSAPVVDKVPRALENRAPPPMNVDTQRTKSTRVSLVWVALPVLAVLGVGGYVAWDLWKEQQKVADTEKAKTEARPTLPVAPVRREEPKPEPVAPKPEAPDEDLGTLTGPRAAAAGKKKPAKAQSATEKALADLERAYKELADKSSSEATKFKLRKNILTEKLAGTTGDNEAALLLDECRKLQAEIHKTAAALQ